MYPKVRYFPQDASGQAGVIVRHKKTGSRAGFPVLLHGLVWQSSRLRETYTTPYTATRNKLVQGGTCRHKKTGAVAGFSVYPGCIERHLESMFGAPRENRTPSETP